MSIWIITVNGRPVTNNQKVEAHCREQAVNKWTAATYGSVFSSRAPYNISATRETT